jgi:dTMP kinase
MDKNTNKRGKFITFEGSEGAGKTTQINLLKEYLTSKNIEVVSTREPGGTPLAEKLREIIKHFQGDEVVSDKTELLLMEAARNQHVVNVIEKSLSEGKWVICDRFYDSTTAYQGYGRKMDLDFIEKLNYFAIDNAIPDLTIYFDLPLELGFERTRKRYANVEVFDRFESQKLDFYRRIEQGFKDIAEKNPDRMKIIDATGSIEQVHQQIRGLIDEQF